MKTFSIFFFKNYFMEEWYIGKNNTVLNTKFNEGVA